MLFAEGWMISAGRLFAVVLLLFCFLSCSRQPVYPGPFLAGQDIIIDSAALQEGIPRFFSYSYQGRYINFFVVKTEDRILSFLDACLKCYPKKLGFRHEGASVFCRACNEHYPVSEIEKGFGSCYPVKIEGKTEGGKYVLKAAKLETNGEKFFR